MAIGSGENRRQDFFLRLSPPLSSTKLSSSYALGELIPIHHTIEAFVAEERNKGMASYETIAPLEC